MLRAVHRIEEMKQSVAELIDAYGIRNILAAMYAYCEEERHLIRDCNDAGERSFDWSEVRDAIGYALDRVTPPSDFTLR